MVEKNFSLKDLKTGMKLVNNSGEVFIALMDGEYKDEPILAGIGSAGFYFVNELDSNLETHKEIYASQDGPDIKEVYRNKHAYTALSKELSQIDLVWKREPKRKMTKADIENELGYSIELIEE